MGKARLDDTMYRRLYDVTNDDLAKIKLTHPLMARMDQKVNGTTFAISARLIS